MVVLSSLTLHGLTNWTMVPQLSMQEYNPSAALLPPVKL